VPKLYIGNQAVLSLFATGRTTGTVLDSGEGITHTVPIYEGYAIPFATTEIPICGRDLTKFMHQMLNQNNPQQNTTPYDLEECENIKIEHGVVALDYDAEIKAANEAGNKRKITLPGGRTIEIKEERLKCAELLFAPTL
jgi:actin